MYSDLSPKGNHINARTGDLFDIFNFRHYLGPNPYLDTAALVFDFALTGDGIPKPLEAYVKQIGSYYPQLQDRTYLSVAHLVGHVITEINKLDMDLHLDRWSLKLHSTSVRMAIQTLHGRTTRRVVYFVWDWFEAINRNDYFDVAAEFESLQQGFRDSVYGGPTVYALLKTAHSKGIPTVYLWDEQLVQYGYGRKQVRGAATTFDRDSRLDSDFTTRKDDCKAFLASYGFPVPLGKVARSLVQALDTAEELGYPVVLKPVTGHKGIGVTANIQNPEELETAYDNALAAIPLDASVVIIVEKHVTGTDFRLLCVNGSFVAAVERRPAFVIGDGLSTIADLIQQENAKPERLDTPTSALGKVEIDEPLKRFLAEQSFDLSSVLERSRKVYLRKVANLSAGGISYDATHTVHPDNRILAEDIAQHFRLTCLGIDVIAMTLNRSWRDGNFGIIEINSAPGIFMHLKPAVGESVDVASAILDTFYSSPADARIPIITFNKLGPSDLHDIVDHIATLHPDWVVGALCRQGLWIDGVRRILHQDYNQNVQNLLRNPTLDFLIVEYSETLLEEDGMVYQGSNMVVLDDPETTEMMLVRDVLINSAVIIKTGSEVSIQARGRMDHYHLSAGEPFKRIYLNEITKNF